MNRVDHNAVSCCRRLALSLLKALYRQGVLNLMVWQRLNRRRAIYKIALCSVFVPLVAATASAQLEASPSSLVFERKDIAVDLEIRYNDEPMDSAALLDHELFVNGNTYKEMLAVTGRPGGVTIRPTESLEIGSYELELDTVHGYLRLPIYAPLTAMESSLESRASALGISVDELKERMGQTTRLERGGIQLNVSPVYYVGQLLHIPLKPEANRRYQWFVNDTPLSAPRPDAALKYVFETPGDYFFRVQESNSEGVVTAQASTLVQAAFLPAVMIETIPNRNLILRGANDYQVHNWSLNGKPNGTGLEWTHTFSAPGQYQVECVSRRPNSGVIGKFHVQRYTIRVVP